MVGTATNVPSSNANIATTTIMNGKLTKDGPMFDRSRSPFPHPSSPTRMNNPSPSTEVSHGGLRYLDLPSKEDTPSQPIHGEKKSKEYARGFKTSMQNHCASAGMETLSMIQCTLVNGLRRI